MEQAAGFPFSTAFNKCAFSFLLFIGRRLIIGGRRQLPSLPAHRPIQHGRAWQGDVGGQGGVPRVLMLNKANEWVSAVDPISFDKKSLGSARSHFRHRDGSGNEDVKIGLILVLSVARPSAVGSKTETYIRLPSSGLSLRRRLALSGTSGTRARIRQRGHGQDLRATTPRHDCCLAERPGK